MHNSTHSQISIHSISSLLRYKNRHSQKEIREKFIINQNQQNYSLWKGQRSNYEWNENVDGCGPQCSKCHLATPFGARLFRLRFGTRSTIGLVCFASVAFFSFADASFHLFHEKLVFEKLLARQVEFLSLAHFPGGSSLTIDSVRGTGVALDQLWILHSPCWKVVIKINFFLINLNFSNT